MMKKILYILVIVTIVFILNNRVNAWSKYEVGKKVTYNGIDYYVIKDSSTSEENVTLLKSEPLSVAEVNQFGAGHVNMNVPSSGSYYQTAYDQNGYGGMQYYSSSTCGYNGTDWVDSGCKSDYASSEVKYVVDAWKTAQAPAAAEARLISKNEIDNNFEFEEYDIPCGGCGAKGQRIAATWMYNINYSYWTNTPYNDSSSYVWLVSSDGSLGNNHVDFNLGVVRPVITISKSVLGDINDQEDIDKEDKSNASNNNSNKESKVSVNVPNTMQKVSIILIMVGVLLLSISIFLVIKNKRVIKNK